MRLDASLVYKRVGRLLCAALLTSYLIYAVYMSNSVANSGSGTANVEYIDASRDGNANSSASSIVAIDVAHSHSVPHRGVWLYVVNENDELLLLKRSTQAVTCPNTWNAPGEHTKHNESFVDAAYRGLLEEVGLTRQHIISITPLLQTPLYLDVVFYGLKFKRDLQWTMSFLVRAKTEHVHMYNHESSLMQWKPVNKCKLWINEDPSRLCKAKEFKFSSAEFNVSGADWSFKNAFEMHIQLIKPHL